jgi:hypothetical protein
MKNSVVPYITIMSPGATTPALIASAAASIVPAVTGVPAINPVSTAAAGVTPPAISADQSSRGSLSGSTIGSAKRPSHSRARTSTRGL